MRSLRFLALPACLCLVLTACSKSEQAGNGDASALSVEIAAMVNGDTISVADVSKVAEGFAANGASPDPTAEGTTYEEKMYYTAVNRLVDQQLVLGAARAHGLSVSDEEVSNSISQLVAMSRGEENFQQMLAERGITMDEVEADMRTNLLLQRYFEEVVSKDSPITPEDVRVYYDGHPEVYGPQDEVHARHILIATNPEMDDMARAEARGKAEQVLDRLKKGEEFTALALEFSDDPTNASNGGDLGWFPRGAMVAPFDSAAFALGEGELSGVVTTNFGYHIIRKEGQRRGEARNLMDPQIQSNIRNQLAGERFRGAVETLREEAEIEVNPPTPEILEQIAA